MTYLDLINAFEKWLETNYLPSSAQLLWYKLIALFNKAGWSEWVTVDNYRLMSIMQIESEKTLIRCRDKLLESNFFEYQKGKKGSPNKYKILTVNFTVQTTVQTTVQMGVKTTANVSNINRIRQDKEKEKNISSNVLYNPEIEKIQEIMIETIGTTNINNIQECISYLDKLPIELIENALRKTARAERPSWQYAIPILESYITKGIKTIEEVQADDLKHKNKTIKSTETIEEQSERLKRKWGITDED